MPHAMAVDKKSCLQTTTRFPHDLVNEGRIESDPCRWRAIVSHPRMTHSTLLPIFLQDGGYDSSADEGYEGFCDQAEPLLPLHKARVRERHIRLESMVSPAEVTRLALFAFG